MSVKRSHAFSVGIVGLPNAGKSTLFNAVTKASVPAENYPFCTIDKNVGVVAIPDPRLDLMEDFFHAEKKVPSLLTFVDIAGLVKGASEGEGLGNQFLSHIREVDVIMYVLRSFTSEKITHVYDRVSPSEDFRIVQTELILKDIETVDKRLNDIKKKTRSGLDAQTKMQINVLEKLLVWFENEKAAIDMPMNQDEKEFVYELWLLSNKKRMFIMNTREGLSEESFGAWVESLKAVIPSEDSQFILPVDVKMVHELSTMSDVEKKEYLSMLEGKPNLVGEVIKTAYRRLNLLTFYTGSTKEVNAWSVEAGLTAKEAAGVIHTDLEEGFITADVVNVEKMIEAGGSVNAKEKGLIRNQGKEYLICDGDYINIYSNK